ncbi:F0F1 ATP synthase subunit A [Neolewinella aurantiaca]|uniref:ATP synthase subunit a n=1 Tax=Neolewinella aurantiaca TaxID=2602767 RepID=A0A5C7FXS7_9BACT|nr:F0F1 ATP synthase subunit A [Neolewinella aurantiaca]TXF91269.1 F0F1 ATP synthase subunit A [Neolewinella aurantiaca]
MKLALRALFLLVLCFGLTTLNAQHDTDDHGHASELTEQDSGAHGSEAAYDPVGTVMHHIADANEFHILGHYSIPLPVILYAPEHGFKFGLSSMFDHGHEAVDGYVLNHGRVNRVADPSFPSGHVHLSGEHPIHEDVVTVDGKKKDVAYLMHDGKKYMLDKPSTLDGGVLGGGITSFYDFSITKNVFTMLLATILLFIIFSIVARGYKKNEGKAPSGLQSFMEPIFVFIRDEVSRPMIGEKHYERFQPFVMALFFFILFCNLLGLIPFFPGSSNVTGNLGVTMALAVIVFIVTNLNGKKDYWEHIFWMPGVPVFVKPVLAVVEILGLFIKPFSLMIRLFANISAGHIIILSLIGLVFVFGENGTNVGGAATGAFVGGLFTAFMNLIELLVAFLQAFIFSMLAASYIGAAVEEHDHHDESHAVDHHHGGAHAEAVAHH